MSGMTVDALKGANIGLDEFRSMVNYVNPKNKGYVRAIKGADGKVCLEKINNWLSFAYHSTNLSDEHNRALRNRMIGALGGDLQYMTKATRQNILKAITKCGDNAFDANGYLLDSNSVSSDRLKRTEIRAALELYDAQFNTPEGRKGIVNRMCIDLVKNFIALSGDVKSDAKTAKKYIEENLHLRVDDLLNPQKLTEDEVAGKKVDRVFNNLLRDVTVTAEGGSEEFTVPMADAATFRLMLSVAKNKIGEALLAHQSFDRIYTTLAQNMINRGELFDYAYDSEIAPGTDDYNQFSKLFDDLAADKLGYGNLSEDDRALLSAHSSKATGSNKIVKTYIRYVLGNRLFDIMSKVDPEQKEKLKALVAAKDLKALKNELETSLDLYNKIKDDALKFCRGFQAFRDEWIEEDMTFKENGSDMKEKMAGKAGQVLLAVGLSKKVADQILAEIKRSDDYSFSSEEKVALYSYIKEEKWDKLYQALEGHYASLYNQQEFGIDKVTDVKSELKKLWTERSQDVRQACVMQAKNGGIGKFAENVQNLVDEKLKEALAEKKVPRDSPNFSTAYNLAYTYVMSGMFNDKQVAEKLLSDSSGLALAKATMLIANVTGMVTRLLDDADAQWQKELSRVNAELTKQVKAGKLKEADAQKLNRKFVSDYKAQIDKSLTGFLSGVELNPDDSLIKIMSQGRKKESFEWVLDLFGLNNFEKDEMTPELKKQFESALGQAKLNARYDKLQSQIGDSYGVKSQPGKTFIRKEDINLASWTQRALAKAETARSSLSGLFASQESFRKTVVENWMNKAFKQFFCDAMEGDKKLFTQGRHIDRTLLEKAMLRFDEKALKAFKAFDAAQSAVLTQVKANLSNALANCIRANNPAATEKEIGELVPQLVDDAFASGLATISENLERALASGDGALPRSGSEEFDNLVDRIALGILNKADASLQHRGEEVLKVIDGANFKETQISAAVKTLIANPQCAELLKELPAAEAERVVTSLVSPLMPGILADIRRLPATLTLGKGDSVADKVTAFVQWRLTGAVSSDRISKFLGFREQFKEFVQTDEAQKLSRLRNREGSNLIAQRPVTLLDDHFKLICEAAIYEDLPLVLDEATADTVIALMKNKVEERIGKVAESFDLSLASFKTKLGQDGKMVASGGKTDVGSLGARLNSLIDKALFGSEENGSKDLIAVWERRLPALGSMIDNTTFAKLSDPKYGVLRLNLVKILAKVMLDNFIDIQRQVLLDAEVSGAKLREAERLGRQMPELEIKKYKTVDAMVAGMSDDEILARLNEMLEGSLRKANEILSQSLSVDAMLSDFGERFVGLLDSVPQEKDGGFAIGPEVRKILTEDVRSALELNEENRKRLADADRKVAAIAIRDEIANLEDLLSKAPADRSALIPEDQHRIDDYEARLAKARHELELVELGYLEGDALNVRASDPIAKAMFVLQAELARLEAEVPQDQKAIEAKRQEIEDHKIGTSDRDEILRRFDEAAGVVECDMLKRMKSFVNDTIGSDRGYEKYASVKAKAVKYAFDLWAGNFSESDLDDPDVEAIMEYRKTMQTNLIDRLLTDLRVEDFGNNVNLVMGYVRDQLTFKNVRSDMADDIARVVTENLMKIRDKAADSVGDALNDEFRKCLDGIRTLGDIKTKIDDLLWLASQQVLAEQFQSTADSPLVSGLASRMLAKYDTLGHWMDDHGLKNRRLKQIETESQQQLMQEIKIFVRVALAEVFGLKTDRDAQAQTFEDSRQTLIKFLTDPDWFEQTFRGRFLDRFNGQFEDLLGKIEVLVETERAWRECMPDVIRSVLPIHLQVANETDWTDSTTPEILDEIRRHHEWMDKVLSGAIESGKAKSITIDGDTRNFEMRAPDCRDLVSHDWMLFIALQLRNDYGFDLFDGKHAKEVSLLEKYVGKLKDFGDILLGNLFIIKQRHGKSCSHKAISNYVQDAIFGIIKAQPQLGVKSKKKNDTSIAFTALGGEHWFGNGPVPSGKKGEPTLCVIRDDIDQIREGLSKMVKEINEKIKNVKPETKTETKSEAKVETPKVSLSAWMNDAAKKQAAEGKK